LYIQQFTDDLEQHYNVEMARISSYELLIYSIDKRHISDNPTQDSEGCGRLLRHVGVGSVQKELHDG
jgi:hypothetical protein